MNNQEDQLKEVEANLKQVQASLDKIRAAAQQKIEAAEKASGITMIQIIEDITSID